MKVLVVSQAYPPYPIVGALRAAKVAAMFRDRGHNVTVVTERLEAEQGDVRVAEDGLVVRTVHAGLPYRLRLVALRNRLRGRSVPLASYDGVNDDISDAEDDSSRGPVRRCIRTLRHLLIGILRLPDDQQQFVPPALRMSREVIRTGVDLIYTTAPAFSTHFVGLLLRRSGVRWVAEFRDPWTIESHRGSTATAAFLLWMNRWLERQCLVHADAVVAVTESVGRQIAAKLPAEQRRKVIVAMNGIDELHKSCKSDDTQQPFRIAYTGSFYHDRDPRPFLSALAAWICDEGFGPDDVQVDFAGRCRHYANISVEQIVHELDLSDIVRFHDWLPSAEVDTMIRRADLVLLLARSQPAQVPNKLFDYLGVRTPILAVVDQGGESEYILNAVGGQFVLAVPERALVPACAVRQALESAYGQRGACVATNEVALEALLSRHQFNHLATALQV